MSLPSISPSIPKNVHFVGIGGVGMSGIARVLLNLGCSVSGSDLKLTELTRGLEQAGARIFEGHKTSHVGAAGAVVVSSAVKPSNPEVLEARRRGIAVLARAQMLAQAARLKKTVTVAGSHGKTTTTSMAAMALQAAGADPTIVIGGQLKNLGTNARLGSGDYLVAEADESDGSFLYLQPLVAIVTNVDNDHLDHYRSMARLKRAFLRHIQSVPSHGAAVLCAEDPVLSSMIRKINRPAITYAIGARAEWRARRLELSRDGSRFELMRRGRKVASVRLRVPGRHNVLNALGAIAAASFLGFDLDKILKGLAAFRGVGRRLDRLGDAGAITFLDDYGHHPTEIRATLAAVSQLYCGRRGRKGGADCARRRLIVVFQPHRFSRTKMLWRDFGPAFKAADRVYVTEIYSAGEKPIPGVASKLILDSIRKNGVDAEPFHRAVDLAIELRRGDVVLSLGAGDVWKIGEDIRRRILENMPAIV